MVSEVVVNIMSRLKHWIITTIRTEQLIDKD